MNASLRPKNLNLSTIRFPVPAIISILHRLSGFALFLFIPFLLWIFSYSFTESGFETLQQWFATLYFKLLFWVFFAAYIVHLVAGLRHLLSDIGIGDSLRSGKLSAQFAIILSLLLIILAGIWLW